MSDQKNNQPDMDLISAVQKARMAHDEDAVPSKVPGVYWIEAKAPEKAEAPTPRAGAWHIPLTVNEVDDAWAQIKAATQRGELGYKSKVSTSPASDQAHRDARLIMVMTYDADDEADVTRVEKRLKELVTLPMTYQRG